MPKRPCPSETNEQPLKKHISQIDSKTRTRKIRSSSAEKTLQLLYEGATKFFNNEFSSKNNGSNEICCDSSSVVSICMYCDRKLCARCTHLCYNCNQVFCSNCSFPTYDQNESACYSCYR